MGNQDTFNKICDHYLSKFEVMRDKEKMKNCHILQEVIEIQQLNAMWDSGLGLGSEK